MSMYNNYEQYIDKDDDKNKKKPAKGKRRGFEDDDQSNFVNAEVVRRSDKLTRKDELEEEARHVTLEINEVFDMKPKARMNWLKKAIEGIKDGSQKPTPIFDIFVHKKFEAGLAPAEARRALYLIKSVLEQFSWKQQKFVDSNQFNLHKMHSIVALDSDSDEGPIEILDNEDERVERLKKTQKDKEMNERRLAEVMAKAKAKGKRGGPNAGGDAKRAKGDDSSDSEAEEKPPEPKVYEELRMDPADGAYYTKQDFIDQYGGTDEWEAAFVPSKVSDSSAGIVSEAAPIQGSGGTFSFSIKQ